MGGVIIWGTVIILALLFLLLDKLADGFWSYFNFVNRAQTYLPLATMLIAGIIGLFDDFLGILRIGPKGGGLQMGLKIILYTSVAVVGAWWFYFRLGWSTFYVPFWVILKSAGGISLFLYLLSWLPLFPPTKPMALTVWPAARFCLLLAP